MEKKKFSIAVRRATAAVFVLGVMGLGAVATSSVASASPVLMPEGWGQCNNWQPCQTWPSGNNGCWSNQCGPMGMPWGWSMIASSSINWGEGVPYSGSRGTQWFKCPLGLPPGAFLTEWNGTVYWVA